MPDFNWTNFVPDALKWGQSPSTNFYDSVLTSQAINPSAYNSAMGITGAVPNQSLVTEPSVANTGNPGGWFSKEAILGGIDPKTKMQTQGWGGLALGAAQGLMGGYLGMKQYGLAKDQLAESKRQFEKNFGAQRQMTNTRLEDRQRARVASNPGAYQSVGEYMKKHEVK